MGDLFRGEELGEFFAVGEGGGFEIGFGEDGVHELVCFVISIADENSVPPLAFHA